MRDYFDRIITMQTKKKATLIIGLVILLGSILSQVEFTRPELPLIRHKGMLAGDIWMMILFLLWIGLFLWCFNYFLRDPDTLGLRAVVRDNFLTVACIGVLFIFFSITIMGYLVTGKFCLFINRACLN